MSYGTQWGPADGPGGHPALHVSGAAQPETLQSQGEVFIFLFNSTAVSTSNSKLPSVAHYCFFPAYTIN